MKDLNELKPLSIKRITELAEGKHAVLGDLERLAITALCFFEENKSTVKAFQSVGFCLLEREQELEAMQQRAEAAEAAFRESEQAKQQLFIEKDQLLTANLKVGKRANEAEAKLAELAKQEPYGYVVITGTGAKKFSTRHPRLRVTNEPPVAVFTRPAPAAPAAPVFGWLRVVSGQSFQIMEGPQRPPDRSGNGAGPWFAIYRQPPAPAADLAKLVPDELTWSYHDNITQGEVNSWNDCRAAILRNIEGAGRND